MEKIPQWEVFEFSRPVEGFFENPFLDVHLQAIFTTAGSEVYKIDGFYDGIENSRHIWRIRFAPMHEGKWSFVTIANLSALDGLTGEFQCTEPVSQGPLCVHPEFPNWFSREDGSAQLIINEGWLPHPACSSSDYEDLDFRQPSEKDFEKYIDILSEHKVNMLIGMSELYARQTSVTDTSFIWPWKVIDSEKNKIDKERFNLDFYRRWERTIQYAKKKGLFYVFELLYDNSLVRPREWSNHPYNKKNGGWLDTDSVGDIGWHNLFDPDNELSKLYLGRYLRYTLARLACYWNICWEVGAENANLAVLPHNLLPNALLPVEKIAAWMNYWSGFIRTYDPYHRLCTLGDTTHHPLMVSERGNDFILTQDPRNYPRDDENQYYKAMNLEGIQHWQYHRPMVIGEMDCSNRNNYHLERRMYWVGLTSGYAMSRFDRHFGLMNGTTMIESEKFNLNDIPPIYKYLKILYDYVEKNVEFRRMSPENSWVKSNKLTCTLAEKSKEYLIYFPFGGDAELSLPAAVYEWFNPRSGNVEKTGQFNSGTISFQSPDEEDWVLHIKVLNTN